MEVETIKIGLVQVPVVEKCVCLSLAPGPRPHIIGETPADFKNCLNTTFTLIINKRMKLCLFYSLSMKSLKLYFGYGRPHLEYSSVSVQAKLESYSVQTNQGKKVDNKLKVG